MSIFHQLLHVRHRQPFIYVLCCICYRPYRHYLHTLAFVRIT